MALASFSAVSADSSAVSMLDARYCYFITPVDGETVSGTIDIIIEASRTPTLYVDGVRIGRGYAWTWDTTTTSDGVHSLYARIAGASDTIYITVDNGGGPPPDTEAPTVTITNPAAGTTVSGMVSVTAVATDNVGVTQVEFYIDDVLKSTDTSSPYSWNWDTTAYSDANHDVKAIAYDAAENTDTDINTVTVDNGGTPPPPPGILPWWHDVIDVDQQSYTGAGTVIVIIDTGLVSIWQDYFPAENILTSYCRSYTQELGKDTIAWNRDTEGHGTAVTGTIIGYYLNNDWIRGVAQDAKIVMLRCLYWIGGVGSNRVTETEMLNNWANCINYARSLKAGALSGYNMVISMSLGYDNTNTALNNAIDNAEAEGIVVSTSAGNDGPSPNTTAYPANLADCTSVAACGYTGLTGAYGIAGIATDIPEGDFSGVFLSSFSSRGKVDIAGIGENLVLPYYGGYYYISGTSFSCPQISGIYALMFEAWGAQSVAWLESKLQSTAVDLGYTSSEQGAGFAQADGATS